MFSKNLSEIPFTDLISNKINYLKQLAADLREDDPSKTLRILWYLEQESSVLREIIARTFIESAGTSKEN